MNTVTSINPANGESFAQVPATSLQELPGLVKRARKAQREWAKTSVETRANAIRAVADELTTRATELSVAITSEMGMPCEAARFNVERSAHFLRWYADSASSSLSPQTTFEDDNEIHVVTRIPRGVHAAIFPWNYPYSNQAWACGQSLLAGNAVLLKMSEVVPKCAQQFAEVIHHHLPPDVFIPIFGDGTTGQVLLQQKVDFVSFTGSTNTGRLVYEAAAKLLVPAVMELGGSAPGIVCSHVDLSTQSHNIAAARLGNSGQRCDGLKRLIVHESIVSQVVEALKSEFDRYLCGDPTDPQTKVGPLATRRQFEIAVEQANDAVDKGGSVVYGTIPTLQKSTRNSSAQDGSTQDGSTQDGPSQQNQSREGSSQYKGGAFFAPMIIINVSSAMRIWKEEVFAPILPVVTYSTDDEAIKLANETEYGLGSHIYCADQTHSEKLADEIDASMSSINGAIYTRPWNPFGGTKCSGFGVEHGTYGFHEVTIPRVVARAKHLS